jgi:MFS family permease
MSRLADLVVPARLGQSFRRLLASSWMTNLGDGITLAAGPLLVASQTHNPLAVAMATFLQRLPWLMFGLYAGVVADRGNRRVIVITTGLVRPSAPRCSRWGRRCPSSARPCACWPACC